jgi:uncharacterized protein
MKSLAFPDVNVWLALLLEDHVHRTAALHWWNTTSSETIAFCRFTQMSVLRLLTTDAAMNGRPLTMPSAWKAYDRLFEDDRVAMLSESAGLDDHFRRHAALRLSSPKLWADAYLSAFAVTCAAGLVTFDRALARRLPDSILLAG